MTPLRIVAVGAHPDDVELSMGGLLLRFARAGHHVAVVVATDGAAGGKGAPGLAAIRAREARAGADRMGATLQSLGFPDGRLAWRPDAMAAIGAAVAGHTPNLVITHAENDYHPDHRAVARVVGDIAPAGVPVLRADNMLGLHFAPDLLVDIGDVFDAKLEALAQHASQAELGIGDAISVWNRFRGLQAIGRKFRHAEAYATDRRLAADARRVLDRIGGYASI